MSEYESLRRDGWTGFAQVYLKQCHEEAKSNNEIDKEVYNKLVELDTRLGTTASEQLFESYQMKKLLNELGGYILREAGMDFQKLKDHDWIKKKTNYAGYADYYLSEYDRRSDADATIYRRLLDIDAVCGTDASLQLFRCIKRTTRCDIIKVCNFHRKKRLKMNLDN